MLVEPPRPRVSGRAGPPLLSAAAPRVRIRRRGALEPASRHSGPDHRHGERVVVPIRSALLVAALVLAVSSRGDVFVLALVLSLGVGRRASAFAASVALISVMVRWGSPSLAAIAGAQAVLGPAGWTGSRAAVASAWLAAIAVIGATRRGPRLLSLASGVSVAPFAVAAADVVAGPSIGGEIGWRVVATIVAFAVALIVSRWRRAPECAVACAVAALVTAAVA